MIRTRAGTTGPDLAEHGAERGRQAPAHRAARVPPHTRGNDDREHEADDAQAVAAERRVDLPGAAQPPAHTAPGVGDAAPDAVDEAVEQVRAAPRRAAGGPARWGGGRAACVRTPRRSLGPPRGIAGGHRSSRVLPCVEAIGRPSPGPGSDSPPPPDRGSAPRTGGRAAAALGPLPHRQHRRAATSRAPPHGGHPDKRQRADRVSTPRSPRRPGRRPPQTAPPPCTARRAPARRTGSVRPTAPARASTRRPGARTAAP